MRYVHPAIIERARREREERESESRRRPLHIHAPEPYRHDPCDDDRAPSKRGVVIITNGS
jgi:hypothetical protein